MGLIQFSFADVWFFSLQLFKRTDYTEGWDNLIRACSQTDSLCSANGKCLLTTLWFRQIKPELRESAARSFSVGNGWFASSWKFSLLFYIFWKDGAWLTCSLSSSLVPKMASSGPNAERAGGVWLLCLPLGPIHQLCSDKHLFFVSFQTPKNTKLICFLCLAALLVCLLPLRWTNAPLLTRLYLLTATLSTRAASPPSTTKTCTTTRISGTCESVWPVHTVYTLGSAVTSRSSTPTVSVMHLTSWPVLLTGSAPYLTLLTCLISSSRPAKIKSLPIFCLVEM